MVRILFAALIAASSTAGAAQMMMGSAVSTAEYSPLVDGSRYDYMYTSGPWASSTVVMHGGQT